MKGFAVKGWCPDAWRPMTAGDGLLMRVKPRLNSLTRAQVLGLCDAALALGNGQIDFTRRANLQLRGVSEAGWQVMLDRLMTLELVECDPVRESGRNVLVSPDWQAGDDTHRIAGELLARYDEWPELPSKMGFVIDAGRACMLPHESGDLRLERGETGALILRAEGRAHGFPVAMGQEAGALIALARWFVDSGGASAGRMVRHVADLPAWAKGNIAPAPACAPIQPGPHGLGMAYGLPLGRTDARALAAAMERSEATALRCTPWRVVVLEGAPTGPIAGLLDDPADPLLRVDACAGAPDCPQATVETRDLARALAPLIPGQLHVSGCAKGCARSGAADVVLTGRNGLYDLAFDAQPGSLPIRAELGQADLLRHFGAS